MNNIILFDRYKVISLLGTGSYANVYLVEHLKLKTYRAMKQIKKAQTDMSGFLKEAHLLKNLNHPGIPVIFDYEEDETYLYMFEEFVEGESLDEFISQRKFITMQEMLTFGLQICSVLNYLHQQEPYPILYQDFKPEHLYISKNQVKFVDFGLAMMLSEHTTSMKLVYGTKEYCAPEKIKTGNLELVSDIYGTGKILQFLFEAVKSEEQNIAVRKIIEQAVETDPSKRFQEMKDLEMALTKVQKKAHTDEIPLQENTRKHLIKKIAIGSSQSRIGATHFAYSLKSYLDFHKESAVLTSISDEKEKFAKNEISFFTHMHLKPYKKSFWKKEKKLDVEILDYGYPVEESMEFLEADICIVIFGTKSWEIAYANLLFEKFQFCKNMIFICNWGDQHMAKKMAKRFGHRVYCFPLDADPFCHTNEKERFFSYMRSKERW